MNENVYWNSGTFPPQEQRLCELFIYCVPKTCSLLGGRNLSLQNHTNKKLGMTPNGTMIEVAGSFVPVKVILNQITIQT